MGFTEQIKSHLSLLAEKTGKTEREVLELAVFELYQDKHKWIISPNTGEMWFKDEIPIGDDMDIVEVVDSTGQVITWIVNPDAETSRKIIGDRIRHLRTEAGMSLDKLTELTGVARSRLIDIEKGRRSTGIDILSKITAALGKKLDIV